MQPPWKEPHKNGYQDYSPANYAGSFEDNAQDPADLLENTLSQLEALLWVCQGEGIDWHNGEGPRQLDNLLWLAAGAL